MLVRGTQDALVIAVALELLHDFWLMSACTFRGNARFPTGQGRLASGCLPPREPCTWAAWLWPGRGLCQNQWELSVGRRLG